MPNDLVVGIFFVDPFPVAVGSIRRIMYPANGLRVDIPPPRGIILPVPTSGSNDWAKVGTVNRLSKVAIVSVFFISCSVLPCPEPVLAFSYPRGSPFKVCVWRHPAQTQVPVHQFHDIRPFTKTRGN